MMTMSCGNDQVLLVTAGYDHTIRFWQAYSGVCYRTVQHADSQVNAMEITYDKQMIAAAGYQHIRLYDMDSKNPNPLVNYDGVNKNVTSVGFHEQSKWMYSSGEDKSARIWDLRSNSLQCQRILQVNSAINCATLHPNQCEMFIGCQDGSLHIWDLRSNVNQQLTVDSSAIQSISIDHMGTSMATINSKGTCYLWRLVEGRDGSMSEVRDKGQMSAHQKYGLRCLFSPDSTLLATASADGTCKIWRTADMSLLTELKDKSQRWVWDCAFSGDSQYVITASSDNTARLWEVDTSEIKKEYSGHQKAIVCLAFKDEIIQ